MDPQDTAQVEPAALRWEDENTRVGITWSDGHESSYTLDYLRQSCPCATCRNLHADPPIPVAPKRTGLTILTSAQVAMARASARVREAHPVGHYAIRFVWEDGHDHGIYSYRRLRALCPCEACRTATTE